MASNSSTMEDVLTFPKPVQQERRLRPQPDHALKCPRCDSTNTKFCYYNNYSLSQPRYFCKGCRRYWTQGGTLRNVPVGGGCRKNKRSSSSSKRSSQDHHLALTATNSNSNSLSSFTPLTTYDSNDLTLAFARLHNKQPSSTAMQLGLEDHCDFLANSNSNNNGMNNTTTPFVDALRSGYLDTQIGFHQNFNYGFGNEEVGDQGEAEVVVFPYEGAAATTATVTTTTKQELCKGRVINNGENSRGFWNFPWHIGSGAGGDHHHHHHQGSIGGVDSGRECWINGIGPSWHGLINSPLM